MVRKAEKSGIEVREASYDDAFVRGMTDIFNETPVRQGRKFWHYGKDFDTVKREFSRFLFREQLIGAYYRDELVGFVMLANAGKYGVLGQIISKVEHRNKAINNALIAHTIKKCETQQLPYPSRVLGKNRSDSVTASLTHVFGPTMTNEFIFGPSQNNLTLNAIDPKAGTFAGEPVILDQKKKNLVSYRESQVRVPLEYPKPSHITRHIPLPVKITL